MSWHFGWGQLECLAFLKVGWELSLIHMSVLFCLPSSDIFHWELFHVEGHIINMSVYHATFNFTAKYDSLYWGLINK